MPDCKIQNPTVSAQENCPSNRKLPQPTGSDVNHVTLSACQSQIRSLCFREITCKIVKKIIPCQVVKKSPESQNCQSCKSDPPASRISSLPNCITLLQRTTKVASNRIPLPHGSRTKSHCFRDRKSYHSAPELPRKLLLRQSSSDVSQKVQVIAPTKLIPLPLGSEVIWVPDSKPHLHRCRIRSTKFPVHNVLRKIQKCHCIYCRKLEIKSTRAPKKRQNLKVSSCTKYQSVKLHQISKSQAIAVSTS